MARGGDTEQASSALLLHGLHGRRANELPLMRRLHADGYNVLAIAFAPHGDSDGSVIDFGYSSRDDVVAGIKLLNQQLPDRPVISLRDVAGIGGRISRRGTRAARARVRAQIAVARTSTSPRRDPVRISTSRSAGSALGLRMWASAWLGAPKLNRARGRGVTPFQSRRDPPRRPATGFALQRIPRSLRPREIARHSGQLQPRRPRATVPGRPGPLRRTAEIAQSVTATTGRLADAAARHLANQARADGGSFVCCTAPGPAAAGASGRRVVGGIRATAA